MNPTAIVANEDNCAKYYNCSVPLKNNRAQECPYPYLFSRITAKCETFTSVACDSRPEPQNPCKLIKSLGNVQRNKAFKEWIPVN